LEEITTVEQANIFLETYLPCFNEHFARPSLAKEDLHRPLSKALFLDEVFYIKESCSEPVRRPWCGNSENMTYRYLNLTLRFISESHLTQIRIKLCLSTFSFDPS